MNPSRNPHVRARARAIAVSSKQEAVSGKRYPRGWPRFVSGSKTKIIIINAPRARGR